jgi:hypothetical protein
MRNAVFQRLMHRLAMAATLALVLVPALGRMAQANHAAMAMPPHAMAMSHDMPAHDMAAHDMSAHDMSAHAQHHAAASAPAPEPPSSMPHHGGGDCDYCPLLASMVAAKAPALIAPARAMQAAPMPIVATATPPQRHPTGLLSRGPPTHS